jgi:nifR3 family TIM-barrel protein
MNIVAQKLDSALSRKTLPIGAVTAPNRIFLAPMSGVTDAPFRKRAAEAGAGLVVSEMVASQEFVKGSQESIKRARASGSGIHMVQLAGREAYWMGEAAKAIEAAGADIIDINMGCPAKKVTGGYSGSALMRDLDHAMTLVEATVNAVDVPVTLKMRLGWDDNTINAPELAKRAENAGVQMITVHGRTRCQFYGGTADWAAVRAVRDAITVPLTVNGDIRDMKSAGEALEQSGADAVMIGRAHYGRPWLAGDLAGGGNGTVKPGFDCAGYVQDHYEAMLVHYGIETGVRHARKHLGWYLDAHASDCLPELRQRILTEIDPKSVIKAIRMAFADRTSTISSDEREAA